MDAEVEFYQSRETETAFSETDAGVPEAAPTSPRGEHATLKKWWPDGSRASPELYLAHFDLTGVHDGCGT